MRMMVAAAVATFTLAGCTKNEGAASNTVAPAPSASGSAAASRDFTPPTSISRADYGGRTERRFHKLDANGDDKIERSELPAKRADRMLRRADKNGDGTIDTTEWSAGMLQRFDKMDANHDGSLTSDERGKRGEGKRGGGRRNRQAQQDQDGGTIPDDGDEVDNGF